MVGLWPVKIVDLCIFFADAFAALCRLACRFVLICLPVFDVFESSTASDYHFQVLSKFRLFDDIL